jgi:putative aldouronate transport system permease protein
MQVLPTAIPVMIARWDVYLPPPKAGEDTQITLQLNWKCCKLVGQHLLVVFKRRKEFTMPELGSSNISRPATGRKKLLQRIKTDLSHNWILYLLILPGFLNLILFKIGPVGAMVIAFQDFSAAQGIFGSQWVGLDNFIRIFNDPYILTLVKNTLILAILSIVLVFPIPIIFSLFLNEVNRKWIRSTVQSFSLLPYFISSAVMVSIFYTILSPSSGIVNSIINMLGGQSVNFMAKPEWFRPLYIILEVWQTTGYSAIIYIAAMMNIDPTLYEAAEVDGASRWGKMFHITLPGISTSVVVMLIISIGNIFTVNLDRILLMYNPSVYSTADVIQTYVYRIAFQSKGFPDYSYGAAVNILKSIIAFVLVVVVNKLADKYADSRLF